jgi:phosphatidylinositol alpha-1,6-mannosyltransferase
LHGEQKISVLVLLIDAYGGRGGIASYNRSLLRALCEHPRVERVLAIPRTVSYEMEPIPDKLDYRLDSLGGKLRYLWACTRTALTHRRFDLIICSHIHLLPIATLLGLVYRCPVVPIIYGIDAWMTTRSLVRHLSRRLSSFISIRRLTARRFIEWAGIPHERYHYLPNCIDESIYRVRPRRADLVERYGLSGKTVVMTAGRLDTGHDFHKGFDEMLEVLPELRKRIPGLAYLVMGDGEDRGRLEDKAKRLGVADITVFTGYVPEADKADHYRLADVFAMPGSNPEFDRYPFRFVFLEALACGVPVVACRLEDPSEMNDPESRLIIQVDPNSKEEIIEGVLAALSAPRGGPRPGIEKFYFGAFRDRLHRILTEVVSGTQA